MEKNENRLENLLNKREEISIEMLEADSNKYLELLETLKNIEIEIDNLTEEESYEKIQ